MKIKTAIISLLVLPILVFAQAGLPAEGSPKAGLTPESPFYFIDKLGEALREFFTFNPEGKARLQITFAAERVAEIKIILETKGVEAKGLEVAQNRLQAHLANAAAIVTDQKSKGKDVSTLARELDDELETPKSALADSFKAEKRALEAKEDDLKAQLKTVHRARDTAKEEALAQELGQVKAQKELLELKEGDIDEELAIEEEKIEEEMEAQLKAEKAVREAEEEKQEMIDEAAEEGVQLPANVFAEFDSLLAQAKSALAAGNFVEAKNLAKRAEKSLDQIEKTIEELEKKQEKKEEADEAIKEAEEEKQQDLEEKMREEESKKQEKLREADERKQEQIEKLFEQVEIVPKGKDEGKYFDVHDLKWHKPLPKTPAENSRVKEYLAELGWDEAGALAVAQKVRNSTVCLLSTATSTSCGGTGWVLGLDIIATCSHCIYPHHEGETEIKSFFVKTVDGKIFPATPLAQGPGVHEGHGVFLPAIDLAVAKVTLGTGTLPPPLPIAPSTAKLGDPVIVVGHPSLMPGGWISMLGEVEFIGREDELGAQDLHLYASHRDGNSGSPIANRHGAIISVLTGGTGREQDEYENPTHPYAFELLLSLDETRNSLATGTYGKAFYDFFRQYAVR